MVNYNFPRTTLPFAMATKLGGSEWRRIPYCLGEVRATTTLTFSPFRGRILFRDPKGQIARIISEDRVNRRRILAGILSVGLLGLLALFLPSFRKSPEPASPTAPALAQAPSETADAPAPSEMPIIPAPVVVAKEASPL